MGIRAKTGTATKKRLDIEHSVLPRASVRSLDPREEMSKVSQTSDVAVNMRGNVIRSIAKYDLLPNFYGWLRFRLIDGSMTHLRFGGPSTDPSGPKQTYPYPPLIREITGDVDS
jgi:hypothetical protein